jgi:hypothetical protein
VSDDDHDGRQPACFAGHFAQQDEEPSRMKSHSDLGSFGKQEDGFWKPWNSRNEPWHGDVLMSTETSASILIMSDKSGVVTATVRAIMPMMARVRRATSSRSEVRNCLLQLERRVRAVGGAAGDGDRELGGHCGTH